MCVFVCVLRERQHKGGGGGLSWWGICLSVGGEFRSFSILPSVSSELCRDGDN